MNIITRNKNAGTWLKSRFIAAAFVLALMLCILPTTIFAEDANVAQIGDTGYATLQAAIDAANAGDTIQLLQDVTLATGANIQLSKSLTFDLNQKTLSGSVSGSYVGLFELKAAVDLAVKNGTLINESTATANMYIIAGDDKVDANVTLENCKMTLSGKGFVYGVYLRPNSAGTTVGNLTVRDCTMNISGAKTSYGIYHSNTKATPNITAENSTISITSDSSGYGIYTGTTGSMNLSGNTITVKSGSTGYGIYTGTTGSMNLSENTINVTVSGSSTGNGIYTSTMDSLTLSGNTVTVQTNGIAYGYYANGRINEPAKTGYNAITLSAGDGKTAYPVRSAYVIITLGSGIYTVNSGNPAMEKVKLEGGYFNFEVPVSQCKAGYYSAPAEDKPGYYALAEISPENASVVATKDGETKYYMTLSGAASECGEGWTLTATKDLTDSDTIGSSSVYAAAKIVIESGVTATTSVFYANHLTVKDGAAVVCKNTFKVSGVNNGTITLTDAAYTIELSNFTNNGSILLKKSDESRGFRLTDKGTVVNNGTIRCEGEASNSYFQLIVSDNGITGTNPYPYAVGMKYYWDYNRNVWYEYYGAATIISPDGTQNHYTNFKAAYDAAADGDTIRLNENQSSASFNNATNTVEKNITVDLNGYALGANCSSTNQSKWAIGVTNGYTLTIIDSSESKLGSVVTAGSPMCVVKVNNGGTLIIDGISITKGYSIIYSEGGAETPDTIIVKNSMIRGVNYGINHNGSYYGADVTVENSTIEATGNSDYSNSGAAIYLSGQKQYAQNTLKVVDSTISGPTAIETKYSDVEVIDSRISTTAQTTAYLDGSNGICTLGFAVASTDNGVANSTGFIKISGERTVVTGYVGLEASDIEAVQNVKTDVQISGGRFNYAIPEDHCVEGFAPVQNEDGIFVIVPKDEFIGFSENMLIIPMGEVAGQHQIALIMGIDTLRYSEVGFDVALNGESLGNYASTVVYRQVKDGAGNVWTTADLGGVEGGYLFANTMGISPEYSAESFGEGAVVTVTPYAVTLDGEKMAVNSYDIPIAYFFN